MLETTIKAGKLFTVKEIWFADAPFEVGNCSGMLFRECKKRIDDPRFVRTEHSTLVIDLTQTSDEIWAKMDKKSCRYEIKRAGREGIIVMHSRDFGLFHTLNCDFRKRKGLPPSVGLEYIARYGTLYLAYQSGSSIFEPLAGQVYLEDDDNIRWLLGASRRLETSEHVVGSANRALIWEAIKDARWRGKSEFDFGGYYTGDSNPELEAINFFKLSFGGELVTRYTYGRDTHLLYRLVHRMAGQ